MDLNQLFRSSRLTLLFVLAVGFALQAPAQEKLARHPFMPGEMLQYKVKWSFIRLGTVIIRQELLNADDPSIYRILMTVRSADGLPFIDIFFTHQAILSKHRPTMKSELVVSGHDESVRALFTYDSISSQIVMVDSAQGDVQRRDSLFAGSPCYEAMGLVMTARSFSGTGDSLRLRTLNDYKIVLTDIVFTDEVEYLEVDAAEDAIRCRRFEGNAMWEGASFGGLTGRFRGWISDDEASIPVRAEVEIFLGSVVLELERFERPSALPTIKLVHDTTMK